MPQLKTEKMTSNPPNKNDLNSKQADSNDVTTSSEDSKILLLDASNADITDTIEAESKKIDTNTALQNEAEMVDLIPTHKNKTVIKIDSSANTKENNKDRITSIQTDNVIVKTECNEIKQTTILDSFDTGVKCKILEECTLSHLDEEKNKNISRVKEVIPESKEEEDNIQDEELDHEIYEELDHEVDEDEINESSDSFNQAHNTVSLIYNNVSELALRNF